MNSKCEVEKTNLSKDIQTNETRAAAEFHVAENQGKRYAEDVLAKARAEDQTARIKVEQEMRAAIFESEQELLATKDLAEAMVAEAEAEYQAAESLKVKREHDLNLAKLEVFQNVARKSKMVVSGDNGDRLIESLLSADVLGDIRLAANK